MSYYKTKILSLSKSDAGKGGDIWKLFLRTFYLYDRMANPERPNIRPGTYKPEIDALQAELLALAPSKSKIRDKAKLENLEVALEIMKLIDDKKIDLALNTLLSKTELLKEKYKDVENQQSNTNTVKQSRFLLRVMRDDLYNLSYKQSQEQLRKLYLERLAAGTGEVASEPVAVPASVPAPISLGQGKEVNLPTSLRSKKKEFPPMLAPQRRTRRARKSNLKTRRNRK